MRSDTIPITIEVSLSDMFNGVFEIKGSLSILQDRLVLRYAEVGISGSVKDQTEVELGHDDVRDVVLKKRPWGVRILIHPKRLTAFRELPGDSHDRIVLRAKRRYRARLREVLARFTEELRDREEYDIPGLPFSLPDAGVSEVKGVLYLESDHIILEVVSGLPGVTESQTMRVRIALEAIDALGFENGVIKDSIFLDSSEEILEVIPGRHTGQLRMRVRRRHRQDSELLVKVVNERRLMSD